MFTGLVEELGAVSAITRGTHSSVLTIGATNVLEGTQVGDSIAVNGVCLTVTALGEGSFSADVMHETLERSSLGSLAIGSLVNLERAMPANGRFGGHIVSGHIDCTGAITKIVRDDNAIWFSIASPHGMQRYVVEKGSIAIDGISLTVARVGTNSFEVSVIPHTQEVTNLANAHVGTTVNLEFDVIGKYVESMLGLTGQNFRKTDSQELSAEFLTENGF